MDLKETDFNTRNWIDSAWEWDYCESGFVPPGVEFAVEFVKVKYTNLVATKYKYLINLDKMDVCEVIQRLQVAFNLY